MRKESIVVTHRADWMIGIGVFAVLSVMGVALWVEKTPFVETNLGIFVVAVSHVIFVIGLIAVVRCYRDCPSSIIPRMALLIEFILVMLLQVADPRKIYLYDTLIVIWSAQLPYFYSVSRSTTWGCIALVAAASIRRWHGAEYFFVNELILHFAFVLFTVFSSRNALAAEQARADLSQRNAELKATQNLLAASAKENERLRIARDLHDTMGHHLTSLALQLELLQHQAADDAQLTLQQAQRLAKLLLTEVRETVSKMRKQPEDMNVQRLFATLIQSVPRIHIRLEIEDMLEVNDAQVAQVLLRSGQEIITNTLKHAEAHQLLIKISQINFRFLLEAYDDGQAKDGFQFGNGLSGMRERVQAIGGKAIFSRTLQGGLHIQLDMPMEVS